MEVVKIDAKKIIVKIAIHNIKKIVIIALIVVALIVFLLSPSTYFLRVRTGTYSEGDKSNVPYMVSSELISNVKFGDKGIYFEKTNEDGTTQKITAEDIWKELIKNGSDIDDYLEDWHQFEKLINAQVITQYPRLEGNDIKLNGTIDFIRNYTDGTSKKLKYLKKDDFKKKLDKEELDIIEYYTLDDQDNLVIGVVNSFYEEFSTNDDEVDINDYTTYLKEQGNTTVYRVSAKKINYKSFVSKYTMPFQFLWAFLVIGQDISFVSDLADLVSDSQIEISIFDNITTRTKDYSYTYKKQIRTDLGVVVTDKGIPGFSNRRYWVLEGEANHTSGCDPDIVTTDHYIKHKTISKTNNVNYDLTKADVWIYYLTKVYDFVKNPPDVQKNSLDLEETQYKLVSIENSNTNSGLLSNPKAVAFAQEYKSVAESVLNPPQTGNTALIQTPLVEVVINVEFVEAKNYKRLIDRKETTVVTTDKPQYVPGTVTGREKVNKKGEGTPNFVSILCSPEHYDAKKLLTESGREWLLEIIESNPDTCNMGDLVRYLLYKVTGIKYDGIDKYDFSLYSEEAFSSVSSAIYSGTIQEKVWYALKDLGYSDIAIAGAMGNLDYESGGFSPSAIEGNGEGIGICQWSFGRKTQLINYASSKGCDWTDEDTQVEFLVAEISGQGPAAGYADQRLSGHIIDEGIEATIDDWANASTVEDATLAFMRFFESCQSTSSYNERLERAWKYWNEFQGKTASVNLDSELTGDNKDKMSQMIKKAIEIANNDNYKYSQEYRNSEMYYDCSSFVSRLYTEYFAIPRLDNGTLAKGTENIKQNCITSYTIVPMNSLQPGDILWKEGHVALYIGEGQTAEALNQEKGIVISTIERKKPFTQAYRIIKEVKE